MNFIFTYDELNETKKQKSKLEIFKDREDEYKTKLYKARKELEEISRNDSGDSNQVKDLKKDIKNLEIRLLQLNFENDNLKYKKEYLKSKLKVTKKLEKSAKS